MALIFLASVAIVDLGEVTAEQKNISGSSSCPNVLTRLARFREFRRTDLGRSLSLAVLGATLFAGRILNEYAPLDNRFLVLPSEMSEEEPTAWGPQKYPTLELRFVEDPISHELNLEYQTVASNRTNLEGLQISFVDSNGRNIGHDANTLRFILNYDGRKK